MASRPLTCRARVAVRELKLERSANFPPRTPTDGTGYTFFQGPTPKTGSQDSLNKFDAVAEVKTATIPLQLKIFGGLTVVLSLWLLVSLVAL